VWNWRVVEAKSEKTEWNAGRLNTGAV
jgi:hypothetical protein